MFKEIINDFKEYRLQFIEWLNLRRLSIKLSLARKLADMKQAAFNKQYFVILDSADRLIALNNNDIERLKRTNCYSPKALARIKENFRKAQEEQIKLIRIKYVGSSSNEKHNEIFDIKKSYTDKYKYLKSLKLLDKRIDGIRLRQIAFYYTKESQNNKMTPEQIYNGKIKYIKYAKALNKKN